jgi:hypothetical protein
MCPPTIPACRAHQGRRAGHPAGLHRRGSNVDQDAGAQALHHPQAGRPLQGAQAAARQGTTRDVDTNGGLQRHAPAHQVGEYSSTFASRAWFQHGHGAPAFSTNTFPTWDLAHPFRLVCHNGEINTVRGNVNWIRARQQAIPACSADLDKVWPLSTTAVGFGLVRQLPRLLMGGYSLAHAMMLMIPRRGQAIR